MKGPLSPVFNGVVAFVKSATDALEACDKDLTEKAAAIATRDTRIAALENEIEALRKTKSASAPAGIRVDEDALDQAVMLCKSAGLITPKQEAHFRTQMQKDPNTILTLLSSALVKQSSHVEGRTTFPESKAVDAGDRDAPRTGRLLQY